MVEIVGIKENTEEAEENLSNGPNVVNTLVRGLQRLLFFFSP